MIIGYHSISLLPRSHTLECLRLPLLKNQFECQLTHQKTFTSSTILIPINSLKDAGIDETFLDSNKSSRSPTRVFKVLLYTSKGTLPFTYFYDNNYSSKKEQVLKIKYFLETETENKLYIKQNNWFAFYTFFFLIICIKFVVIKELSSEYDTLYTHTNGLSKIYR